MLFFKDDKDGYYQFEDDAPKEWYADLTPTAQQLPDEPSPAEIDAQKDAQAQTITDSLLGQAMAEEFTAILDAASISVPANLMDNIRARVRSKL